MKRLFLVLFFACCLMVRPALASEQNLVHGAGTLPHLTSAITLNMGFELPTPLYYSFGYDIGLGNRVQLGITGCTLLLITVVEVHSMFNVLKTARDSDFLSLYLNPSYLHVTSGIHEIFGGNTDLFFLIPGVAYEHRFGRRRRVGLYAKAGTWIVLGGTFAGVNVFGEQVRLPIDFRFGLQALLGNHFSFALEPWLLFIEEVQPGGKAALTWAL